MKTRTRRLGTLAAMAASAVTLCAGTAEASTVYQTGPIAYTCNFPAIGTQTSTLVARLTGPNSAPAGVALTLPAPNVTVAWPASVQALLSSVGYDLIQGTFNGTVGASNAIPASSTFSAAIAPQSFNPSFTAIGSGTITLTPSFPGSSVLTFGATHSIAAQLHKASGTWTAWTFNCTVKTSPVQNRNFLPSIPIT